MKAKVTIITPTYNHGRFISYCIRSVLNQSYKDWEMIIVDDCSTDETAEIVRRYTTENKKLKLIKHRTRWGIKGLSRTYNQALARAKGEYIAILEGDDFWPADKLKKQLKDFRDKSVVFSFGDAVIVNQNNIQCFVYSYKKRVDILCETNKDKKFIDLFNIICNIIPVTVVIRKAALRRIGGFKNSRTYPFVDIPTWLSLLPHGAIAYRNAIYGYYRKHPSSAWFEFARNSSSMGKKEAAGAFLNFLTSEKLASNETVSDIASGLQKLVNYKKDTQKLNIVVHRFIFNSIFQYAAFFLYLFSICFYRLFQDKTLRKLKI